MAGRFDFILDFLTTDHFNMVKADTLKEVSHTLGQITYYDEIEGVIQGNLGGDDGEVHDFEWSFDGHMVNLIITEIEPTLQEVIRELRYGSVKQTKLHSDSDTYVILDRLIIGLGERQMHLSKSNLSIAETQKNIRRVINKLKTLKAKLRKERIWKASASGETAFRGYILTHSRIVDAVALISSIWELLHRRKLVEYKDKKAFHSLFEEKWNNNTIKWLGSPKEFFAFYDALFNPIFKQEEALADYSGYKIRLQKLLFCFDVREGKSKIRIDNKGIRKYSSKPKENSLNKALRDHIEDQLL